MRKKTWASAASILFAVIGCFAYDAEKAHRAPSLESLLAGLTDTVSIYDGAVKDSSHFVGFVSIKENRVALSTADKISDHDNMVWKGSFLIVSTSGIILRVSCYGNFFAVEGGGGSHGVYEVNAHFSAQFGAFVESVAADRIAPWRNARMAVAKTKSAPK